MHNYNYQKKLIKVLRGLGFETEQIVIYIYVYNTNYNLDQCSTRGVSLYFSCSEFGFYPRSLNYFIELDINCKEKYQDFLHNSFSTAALIQSLNLFSDQQASKFCQEIKSK